MTRTVRLTTDEHRTLLKAQRVVARLSDRINGLVTDDRPRLDDRVITRLVTMQSDISFIACTTR